MRLRSKLHLTSCQAFPSEQERLEMQTRANIISAPPTAQQFALDYPSFFDKLILLNTSPIMMSGTRWGPQLDAMNTRVREQGEEAYFSSNGIAQKLRSGFESRFPTEVVNKVTDARFFELWRGELRNRAAFLGYDFRPRLKLIDKPVLIVHGNADPVVPYAHASELLEGIGSTDKRLVTVAGGEHGIWMRSECTAAVVEWLAEQLGSGGAARARM